MSLLDHSQSYEPCTVYMEVTTTDIDGNVQTKASDTGIAAVARFQYQGQSGTSSRRQEQDSEGFETEKVYTMRLPRSFTTQYGEIGAQAEIEWQGVRWSIYGDVRRYNGSPRIRHVEYAIERT